MTQRTVLMAQLVFLVESQASDVADRSTLQGLPSKYMPSGSDAPRSSMNYYGKFITQNLNRATHGNGAEAARWEPSISTKDFNPPTITDREGKQAVQKLVTTDSNNPITLSAIGIGLLSLATMLGIRLHRRFQLATVLASSGGLGSVMPMNSAPALCDNVMEMKTQDPNINDSAAVFATRPVNKDILNRVGWGQVSSRNSRALTLRYAGNLPRPPSLSQDPEVLLVVTCYFLQGALGLSGLALSFYLKDELGLSPADLAALTGLGSAPWVIKPLYGILCDSTPLLGYRRKSYLALSGVLGTLSFAAMATVASGTTEALLFANLIASASVALSDVVVDSLVVEKARDEAEAASLQSVAWGSRYVGAIGAALLSGEAIRLLGARGCFGATAALPLLLTAVALTLDEPRAAERATAAWEEAGVVLGRLRDALLS